MNGTKLLWRIVKNAKLHNAECLTFESWNHSQV